MHGVLKSVRCPMRSIHDGGGGWQDEDLELHTSEVTAYHSLLSQTT